MSALAPTLEAFFTERLMNQKHASRHTIAAYRDAVRLLLAFAQQRSGKTPSRLDFDDLDAPLIGAFLDDLEQARGNSARSRNARLAAIHSLFRFAALRHPEHAALIARVLAIPTKRFDRTIVSFLDHPEINALLEAPDRARWIGRRDHTLLMVAIQTGLRVSELTSLRCQDVQLGAGAGLPRLPPSVGAFPAGAWDQPDHLPRPLAIAQGDAACPGPHPVHDDAGPVGCAGRASRAGDESVPARLGGVLPIRELSPGVRQDPQLRGDAARAVPGETSSTS